MSTPLLSLENAIVRRQGKEILQVEHFVLNEGESVAILGPNGAGKSTFVQLITREVMPLYTEKSSVCFRGNARPIREEIYREIAVVSSTMHDQVRVHLTVLEIVVGGIFSTLGLPHHISYSEEDVRAGRAALARLGVGDIEQRDMTTLSTGEIRRVLIARELIRDPRVLVFDEPCTGLDPHGMFHVRQTMQDLMKQGVSVVLVTHYPEDIPPGIQRVVLIKDAKIYADGKKDNLLNSEVISEVFDAPLCVEKHNGWFALQGVYS